MNTFITLAKLNKEPKEVENGYLLNFTARKFRKNEEFLFCSGFISFDDYKFLKEKLIKGNNFEIIGAIDKIDTININKEIKSISLQLNIYKVKFLYQKNDNYDKNISTSGSTDSAIPTQSVIAPKRRMLKDLSQEEQEEALKAYEKAQMNF
jgi:hypothetical protein